MTMLAPQGRMRHLYGNSASTMLAIVECSRAKGIVMRSSTLAGEGVAGTHLWRLQHGAAFQHRHPARPPGQPDAPKLTLVISGRQRGAASRQPPQLQHRGRRCAILSIRPAKRVGPI